MSPGSRPSRNGSLAPNTSSAPAATRSAPNTTSSFPSSRSGSIASHSISHDEIPLLKRRQRAPRSEEFVAGEEVGNLEGRRLQSVRTVCAVVLNAGAKFAADRARGGLRGIGGTHHIAPALDGVLSFEHEDNDLAGAHEVCERREEGLRAMHGVKPFGLHLGEPQGFGSNNPELRLVNALQNLARQTALDRVGLDDGKCLLRAQKLLLASM